MRSIRNALAGVAFATLVSSLSGQAVASQTDDASRLVGTWRLVSIVLGTSELDPNRGAHPTGLLFYDATGHMAAQIMADPALRRRFVAEQPTGEEAKDAVRTYTAYFGTYRIDQRAHTVTHRREGHINPGSLGDFVRRYEFLPNGQLVLTPVENPNQNRITWERIK